MKIMQEIKMIVDRHKIELIQKYGEERVAELLSREFMKQVYGDPDYKEEPAGILAQVNQASKRKQYVPLTKQDLKQALDREHRIGRELTKIKYHIGADIFDQEKEETGLSGKELEQHLVLKYF